MKFPGFRQFRIVNTTGIGFNTEITDAERRSARRARCR